MKTGHGVWVRYAFMPLPAFAAHLAMGKVESVELGELLWTNIRSPLDFEVRR
jgi:hypothetical protein